MVTGQHHGSRRRKGERRRQRRIDPEEAGRQAVHKGQHSEADDESVAPGKAECPRQRHAGERDHEPAQERREKERGGIDQGEHRGPA